MRASPPVSAFGQGADAISQGIWTTSPKPAQFAINFLPKRAGRPKPANPDGSYPTRNIEDLRPGDKILSKDRFSEGDDLDLAEVTELKVNTATEFQVLMIRNSDGSTETIKCTPEHPFFVEGYGWVEAGNLTPGLKLSEADGSNDATVVSNEVEAHPAGVTVYNLEVQRDHTYFVQDQYGDAVWVHNAYVRYKFGKVGDLVTQATANKVIKELTAVGFTNIKQEVRFIVGRGALKTRFADIVASSPKTGQRIIVQIGKMSKRFPKYAIAREGEAIRDIVQSPAFRVSDTIVFIEKGY